MRRSLYSLLVLGCLATAASYELSPLTPEEEEIIFQSASEHRSRRLESVYAGAKQKLSEIDPIRLGVSTALIMCLGSLAAGAGIGGGGLFVPIYWLILGVGPKGAVPLSGATILGGAIGNFVSIGWQKHPRANRPLIDYQAAVFTQPGELMGVVFGVLLNIILPKIAIVVLLATVLSYNSVRTIRKARATRAKETIKFAEEAEEKTKATLAKPLRGSARGSDFLEGGNLVSRHDHGNNGNGIEVVSLAEENKEEKGLTPAQQAELDAVLADDAIQFPVWVYATLIPMTCFLIVYKMLSGTVFDQCAKWDLTKRGGDNHGWAGGVYWLWYWTPVPVFSVFWIIIAKIIKKRSDRRQNCVGYVPLENDLIWDEKFMAKFPAYALGAGCASGLLGIGGGMILGPIFMAVDMEPRCATSASAFSILWTAGSGTILWVFGGNLGWQLLVWMMTWGFVSGQLGQRMVDGVLKKTGRPSYVIFLLGSIIGTACVAMVASGIATITIDAQNGRPIFYLELEEFKCGI